MITVVQRVLRAEVRVRHIETQADRQVSQIGPGLLLLVGVERGDSEAEADATAKKIAALRIFPGRHPMDRAIVETSGACLVVSQFTLAGTLRKGNRPSFDKAEAPDRARALYERVAAQLTALGVPTALGEFAADMKVELVNDGPVTFVVVVRAGAVLDLPA